MADGPCLWCNVANDVDVAGFLHLCDELLDAIPDLTIILTASSSGLDWGEIPLGAEVAARPGNSARAAEGFLERFKPDVGAIAGSDLPGALMSACKSRQVPLVYLDARKGNERGLRNWLSNLGTGSLLRMFRSIQAVSASDAANIAIHGADPKRIEVTGALEPPPPGLPCDEEERDYVAKFLGTRPVWMAASLPLAEFGIVEEAFRIAGRISHRLLLIVSPENTSDGPEIARLFEEKGWATMSRSKDEPPDEETRVFVADVEGEDGLWYRLASITYLGGSILSGTPPDPYLSGSLGSAIISGEATGDRTGRSARHLATLRADGACRIVRDASSLGEAVSDLLAPDRAAALAGKAWAKIFAGLETTDRAQAVLTDLLTRAEK